MIRTIGPRTKKADYSDSIVVNVTSCSTDFGKELSPFYLGPCKLYGGWVSKTMESAWQYSKVYQQYTTNGEPNDGYWYWASKGWSATRASRYPMGKGAIPLYSLWKGEHLSYIEARRKIYIPLYRDAAKKTDAFKHLKFLYKNDINIVLWDFDGYSTTKSMEEIISDPSRSMGHCFVLKWMLEGLI